MERQRKYNKNEDGFKYGLTEAEKQFRSNLQYFIFTIQNENNLTLEDLRNDTGIQANVLCNMKKGRTTGQINTVVRLLDAYDYKLLIVKKD